MNRYIFQLCEQDLDVIDKYKDITDIVTNIVAIWHEEYIGSGSYRIFNVKVTNDSVSFTSNSCTPGMNHNYMLPIDILFDEKALKRHARDRRDEERKEWEENKEERDLYEKLKYKFDGPKYLDDGWY